jgi:hypothetical protein
MTRPAALLLLALLLLALLAPVAPAQPPTATVATDRTTLGLSESLLATLTVEGPAPLRVDPPTPLLLPDSDRNWRIRPAGPATTAASTRTHRASTSSCSHPWR